MRAQRIGSPRRRGGADALLAILIGVLATVALAFASTDSVDHTNDHQVEFGLPLTWISQDQSASGPPPHTDARLGSPWENPTHVRLAPALADTAIVAVPAALVLLTAVTLRRRTRHR